jgi:hypothetical protein
MSDTPPFDLAAAHRFFAADCFNRAWDLIEKPERTPAEDEAMLHLAIAALWHWTQRPDCSDKNLSVSYWQIARVYVVLGQADEARRYAHQSLQAAERGHLSPFYVAYAYEALACAESLAGRAVAAAGYLAEARRYAALAPDDEHRAALLADLDNIPA